ncbi:MULTISPECIES: glycoside hydrolase family 31 protein [Sphingomonas]|uniref:Glycoside hydrolase family 31 protein n=1 Tax=Sphingomonas zeae TaxID=1646122 RepID=A0A7Y6B3K0_9SPHN|nr:MULTISPECIES: glycoside hydrolase family 31 protein [Sphingomonas]MBB4049666.1 alpha-D-xyloside xylohydrolase [Sphingomonas zeae]MDK8187598.1 glycoside hydrolase family 31 protein [Sphingomonas zeae]MDK8217332.1 glycoside hydrolase family 31 protein [Sphingomonas sp. UMB7805-LC452B]NUU45842.1 glycoside hydrolase family 31 protein [Sphingomonas zeae]
MDTLILESRAIAWTYNGDWLRIEAHGPDGLRLRASPFPDRGGRPGALLDDGAVAEVAPIVTRDGATARITHGRITAEVDLQGRVRFLNAKGELLLEEKWRQRDTISKFWTVGTEEVRMISALGLAGREFRPMTGETARITVRFEGKADERLYGMGQYQQPHLDLAGCTLELAQRNSQASVPFVVSSHGYGLLWNMPAVGAVHFAANGATWTAEVAREIDYWITAADTPADILRNYARVTGTVPMMPDYALGLWQSKLRYRMQEELLAVARDYRDRGIPLAVIVADFFHWPVQGDWRFDEREWPDPAAMTAELKAMGTELLVSVWPTVDHRSENYPEMAEKGYLVRSRRGLDVQQEFLGNTRFIDVTHPGARAFLWDRAKRNYRDKGVALFWLDEAEPEYSAYDFDNYRYHGGSVLEIGNAYPLHYAQAFYEGLHAEGENEIVSLIRCAWAGSQRYGALVWSGDIHSSFEAMRNQLSAGLNMGMAGIPWWTTDIGGFHGGHVEDPAFHELMIRWFQWAVFTPILRMHGHRDPITPPAEPFRDGVAQCDTGAGNELWSFGESVFAILRRYAALRERLRPYVAGLMRAAHEQGDPLMRPMFYDYPDDPRCWAVDDQYMFGPDLLVAPVTDAGVSERSVYLPQGIWCDAWTGERIEGGGDLACNAPVERIPVFIRDGAGVAQAFEGE